MKKLVFVLAFPCFFSSVVQAGDGHVERGSDTSSAASVSILPITADPHSARPRPQPSRPDHSRPRPNGTPAIPVREVEGLNYSNPDSWGARCTRPRKPSPIDINTRFSSRSSFAPTLSIAYRDVLIDEIERGPRYLALLPAEGHDITLDDRFRAETYELESVVFHAQSEHSVDQAFYPLEVQYIHRSAKGKVVIVSVLYRQGRADNGQLGALLDYLAGTRKTRMDRYFDQFPRKLGSYWTYEGAETLPPCADATWIVMKENATLSSQQARAFRQLLRGNAKQQGSVSGFVYSRQ